MVNASLNWASIVGIVLLIGGFAPFFWKTESKGKYDLLMGFIAWICGTILFFQGWRLDPMLQFGQILLVGLTVLMCYENIQLRNRLFKLRNKNSNQYSNNDYESKENAKDWDSKKIEDWDDSEPIKRKPIENKYTTDQSNYKSKRTTSDDNSNNSTYKSYRRSSEANSNNKNRYYRNIGLYKCEELAVMEDKQVYEIVKLQLLGITTGEIKPEMGEVEYLKSILNDLKNTK